ncbi:hypothetical protein DFP72DRAFT_583029 [Ephemerocybe angulata]|uniref:Uncharacterized protein n=1 Tax=Ephemerocybe angulata TaxID=980116 RepID=A0A8H6HKG5_9AGAR|nr:hypothetical protein DFP72DRAFT_583029 [Tulosesus angulatus]
MDTPLTRPIAAAHTEKHRIHLPNDVTASLVMVDSASPTPAGRLRPKMRTVMQSPLGARPKNQTMVAASCDNLAHAYKTSSATLSRTEALTRMPTLRPLPSVPDLRDQFNNTTSLRSAPLPRTTYEEGSDSQTTTPLPTTGTATSNTREKARPLPPTPGPVAFVPSTEEQPFSAPAEYSYLDSTCRVDEPESVVQPLLLIGPRARKRRSQVSQPSRPSTPPSTSVSIPSSRVPSPQPTHPTLPSEVSTPTHPRRLPVPRAGLVDPHDTKANEMFEALKHKPNRHLDLIDLASSISRMWTPSQARTSLDDERDRPEFVVGSSRDCSDAEGWTTDSSLPPPVPPKSPPLDWKTCRTMCDDDMTPVKSKAYMAPSLKPSRLLLPGIGLVEDRHEDDEDESMASSPVKFLNDLTPSKRHTVLTIITLLADEESDHSDSDRTESESEDEGRGERPDWERKWEEADVKGGLEGKLGPDIGLWEFAKRTKKRVRAPALIRKFSHKWEREKDGKRWAEDDYANVLGFLRRL